MLRNMLRMRVVGLFLFCMAIAAVAGAQTDYKGVQIKKLFVQ